MKQESKAARRNLRWYMRYLHNKIGFFIAGLVIIYGLSGIVQTYRDTSFLKHDVLHEKQLSAGLNEAQLGGNLKLRDFKVAKIAGDTALFQGGQVQCCHWQSCLYHQRIVCVDYAVYRAAQDSQ